MTSIAHADELGADRGETLLKSLKQRNDKDRWNKLNEKPKPVAKKPVATPKTGNQPAPVFGLFHRGEKAIPKRRPKSPTEFNGATIGIFRPVTPGETLTPTPKPRRRRFGHIEFKLPKESPKPAPAPKKPPRIFFASQPKTKKAEPKLPPKAISEYDKPFQLRPLDGITPSDDYKPVEVTDRSKRTPEADKKFWQQQTMPARTFEGVAYAWEPSNMSYNPLYFEDPQLERYGHAFPDYVQPFVSIGRFGAQLMGLPYQTAIDPVHKSVYPLGWYAPGECAPKLVYQVPWNAEAAGVEAGVALGLFFLIP